MMEIGPETAKTPAMESLIESIRATVRSESGLSRITAGVAAALERALDDPDLLTEENCREDRSGYRQNILHVEEEGSFSVVALVWLPGQRTPVHDHVSWCVTGVCRGQEHETRYRIGRDPGGAGGGRCLREVGRKVNEPGTVAALSPPGDIHRVGNRGPDTAVSLHVYGADIAELGSSIRRTYDLPVRPAEGSEAPPRGGRASTT